MLENANKAVASGSRMLSGRGVSGEGSGDSERLQGSFAGGAELT